MANTKPNTNATTVDTVKRAKIKLPKEARGEENFVIASVNGKMYKIMKGVEVEVPVEIAEVLEHSDKAIADAITYIDGVAN